MARKSKAEALLTRAEILDAAITVFMENGVGGASLEAIAEAAGVTRGAIYWHFKNKVEIFRELNNEVQSLFIETVMADLDRDHPDPLQQLRELCVNLLLDIDDNQRKRNILHILILRCDYSGEMDGQLQQQNADQQKNIRLFANYFKRAQEKGRLSQQSDPRIMALSLICYLTGTVYEYVRCPKMFKLKDNAEKLVDQFFLGTGR